MLRYTLLLWALLSSICTLQAQTVSATGTGRLTGTVLNATTKQPVEFATVALLSLASSTPITGATCDDKGAFVLDKLAAGEYKVTVSFVGFATKTVEKVTVGATTVSLGQLLLAPSAQQLGEVQVVGQKELVETRADRIVYNAEKDISNAGATAAEMLRKVPLLTVDADGNVELRGSTSVRVLINGKPSSILASSVADALRRLPADKVKSVEVITSPSAKYDAEGTGGVINIILKKNDLAGVTGSVNMSAGTRNSNFNSSLSIRQGKLGISPELGSYAHYNPNRGSVDRTDFLGEGQTARLLQQREGRNSGGGIYGRLGFDYDLTEKDALNVGIYTDLYHSTGTQTIRSSYVAPQTIDQFTRDIRRPWGPNWWPELNLNGGYTHTFKPKQELSLLALQSRSANTSAYNLEQTRPETGLDYLETSRNKRRSRETTLQLDYTQPIDSTNLLELGAKTILRNEQSGYRIEADSLNGRGLVFVPARSNEFRYDQNVFAAYGTYGFSLPQNYSIKAGARVEHTRVNGDFLSSSTTVRQRYTNIIPTLTISRDFGKEKEQKLKLSYARRLQRPSIYMLNPYLDVSNRRVASSGNPNLTAELTDAYELGYSTTIKKTTLNISGYWRQTNNAFQPFASNVPASQLIPGDTSNATIFFTRPQNVARRATYGLNLYGSTKLTDKWTLNGSVNGYYLSVKSAALGIGNEGWIYNGNLTSAWTFEHGLSAQAAVYVNSPRVFLQGRTNGNVWHTLSVKKELFDKKGSLSLAVENPFARTIRYAATLEQEGVFVSQDVNYGYNRAVRLSFNWQFGKMDSAPAKNRKTIQNDDRQGGKG
ncbi:TonB-dependent receptor domain-containing protein [Hymenobacter wooponensis]|uniref:TonB-dependent receptor n=1 Tax=Hymenobacter wooponensis TaxID=1525360 RepID=A0A4Z0MGX7_9BACT|nr:TonB-dependent receptor [Hymenobacter wooponensis]TGD78993.1 TonB-dependent receptor [Hymenobacter wooponensis]